MPVDHQSLYSFSYTDPTGRVLFLHVLDVEMPDYGVRQYQLFIATTSSCDATSMTRLQICDMITKYNENGEGVHAFELDACRVQFAPRLVSFKVKRVKGMETIQPVERSLGRVRWTAMDAGVKLRSDGDIQSELETMAMTQLQQYTISVPAVDDVD